MSAYVIAQLQQVTLGPDIVKYIANIDATLAPYGGRYLIHGGQVQALEGAQQGDVVMLEFRDMDSARRWYESPAYQALLPLRTRNSTSTVLLVEGVPPGYQGKDKLRQLA